jgi:hypothetical protein
VRIDKHRSTAGGGQGLALVGALALVLAGLLIVGVRKAISIARPDTKAASERVDEEPAAPRSDPEPARVVAPAPPAEPVPPPSEEPPPQVAAHPAAAGSVAVAATLPAMTPPQPAPIPVRTAEELRKLTNEDLYTPPYVPTAAQLAGLRENDPPEPAPAPQAHASTDRNRSNENEEDPKPRVLTDEKRQLLQND